MPQKNKNIFIGDPVFTKKMMRLYSWIIPFIFAVMAIAMLVYKAWLSGLLFLCGFVLTFPYLSPFWQRHKIGIALKFILSGLIIALAVYCTKFYV